MRLTFAVQLNIKKKIWMTYVIICTRILHITLFLSNFWMIFIVLYYIYIGIYYIVRNIFLKSHSFIYKFLLKVLYRIHVYRKTHIAPPIGDIWRMYLEISILLLGIILLIISYGQCESLFLNSNIVGTYYALINI